MKNLLLSTLMVLGVNSCSPAMAEQPVPDCVPTETFVGVMGAKEAVPVWKGQSRQDGYVVTVWRVQGQWLLTATSPNSVDTCFIDSGINNEILVGGL